MEPFWQIALPCAIPALIVVLVAVRLAVWLWRRDINPIIKSVVGCLLVGLCLTSCGPIGIGHRPSQDDINLCKSLLSATEGPTLQIMWEEYSNVTTDGVHNDKKPKTPKVLARTYTKKTCPILALYPIQHNHDTGATTDAEFAKQIYQFYIEKYKQDLAGKASKVDARLAAAGLPPLGGSGGGVKHPCPVLVDGKPCGAESTKISADATTKTFKCTAPPPGPHTWTQPKGIGEE